MTDAVRCARLAARRAVDRAVAAAVLRDVCLAAGLHPEDVTARPKTAAHAVVRRAVSIALLAVGWAKVRAKRACGVTDFARRSPPPDLVEVAVASAHRAEAQRRAKVREMARAIDAARDDRPRLIALCDEMGLAVADVAQAIGVCHETLSRWRRAGTKTPHATMPTCTPS